MTVEQLGRRLAASGTAPFCSAHDQARAVDETLMVLMPGAVVAGRAKTALTEPNDNTAVHQAVASAIPGDILFVDCGCGRSLAMLGDLLAEGCMRRGIVGAIVHGCVRDVARLRALNFPVWCTGVNPVPARKNLAGNIDVKIEWGCVLIEPGDWIVADDDGVVVLPTRIVADALSAAEDLVQKENEIRIRLASGESTYEILGLHK